MKLVLLANAYGPRTGGIRTHLDAVRAGYAERGVETVLIVPGPRDDERRDAAGRVIELASPRFWLNRDYRNLWRIGELQRMVLAEAPDSVELADKYTLPRLAPGLRAAGLPVIGFSSERLDQVLPPYLGTSRATLAAIRRYNRWFAARFDRVVCHSDYNRAELLAAGADNLALVPLGVDLERLHPRQRDPARRHELLAGRRLLLLYAGRLVREKRVDLLVGMMLRLEAGEPGRYRLLVAGAGPCEAALRAVPGVTLLGFVPRAELAGLLACADLAVQPSPIESFGLGALEALAAGTPVVAVAGGAVAELVDPRVGALARPHPAALAEAVRLVAARDRERLSRAARRRAEAYPWSRTVESLLALHRRLVDGV